MSDRPPQSGDASPYGGVACSLPSFSCSGARPSPKNPSLCWCFHVFGGPGPGNERLELQDAFGNRFWPFLSLFEPFFAALGKQNIVKLRKYLCFLLGAARAQKH